MKKFLRTLFIVIPLFLLASLNSTQATSGRACGETCTQNSDCMAQTSSGDPVSCYKGRCVNATCPNDNAQGTICICTNEASCGQRCGYGSGRGLCGDGSTCTYVNGPMCPATNDNTYCVPTDNPTISRPKCVARDQYNSYLYRSSDNKSVWSAAEVVELCNPSNGGVNAYLFNNKDLFGTPIITRVDPVMDSTNPALTWGLFDSPDGSIQNDDFSVLWTGQVYAQFQDTYTFYTNSDDGIRLWVDNDLLIDRWFDRGQPNPHDSSPKSLTVGWHNIRVEYYESKGGSIAQVFWSSPKQTGGQKVIIPRMHLRTNYTGAVNSGLTAEYYDNREMQGLPDLTRTDKSVYFDWGMDEPVNGIGFNDRFSVKWTGRVYSDHNEPYTFCTEADDGTRLWINDDLVINNWYLSGLKLVCGQINLNQGWNNLRLDYFDFSIYASVKLFWKSPSQTGGVIQSIPTDHLDKLYTGNLNLGLTGYYFNNQSLSGTQALTRIDPRIDFDWYLNSPDVLINNDHFSVRWIGKLDIDNAGDYKFISYADDGFRLWIDGFQYIDNWQDHGRTRTESPSVSLTRGEHIIQVEYYEYADASGASLFWTTPSDSNEKPVPEALLKH